MLITQFLRKTLKNEVLSHRQFWQWINITFNKVDQERTNVLGPDRTCAEWLLKNGAKVKWEGAKEYLADYNKLPSEDIKLHLAEIDASGSSIMHYGFPHFNGCKYIEKIILHDCVYLQDEGMGMMAPLQEHLKYLQVSKCGNITRAGLLQLKCLVNLETLILYDLPYVTNIETVVTELKSKLLNCSINLK